MRRLGNLLKAAPRSGARAVKIAVITMLGIMLPAGALFAASQVTKPTFSVQVSPGSQSVVRGSAVSYTVTVTSQNGFAGPVAMSASALPSSSTAAFSAANLNVGAGGNATTTLTVSTTASTPVGTYSPQIQGTSGKTTASTTAGLTVNYPLSGSFSLSSAPASLSISPGSSGAYSLSISRTNLTGPISFSLSGLPQGVTASFSPSPATGNNTTLQVTASPSASAGSWTLYIVGSGQDATGKTQYGYASVQFGVVSNGKAFSISGDAASQLAPGVSRTLGLAFSNPNNQPISVTNLSVTIASISQTATAKAQGLPCTAADFAITQYSGPYPLSLPTGSSSLTSVGVPASQWPKISMLDTTANQDGCKGASLVLTYSGSGQGN
ncbi:hypothetical protein [Sinomonas gamaensis]|uniref:COG1470 family protein n=1 Tax=Sinomonas gamaensis TaxID=2565624 RepID=UPI002015FA9D|nr:hypothetical protein [Sinomonas gamaensis]